MALQRSLPAARKPLEQVPQTQPAAVSSALPGKLLVPDDQKWPDVKRVIVLIPGLTPRADRLTQLLALLELPPETPIVLAMLGKDAHANRSSRKALATLTSWIQNDYPAARQNTIQAVSWLDAMRTFAQKHDLVICFAGQHVTTGLFRREPLNQVLFNALNLPTLEISDALPPWRVRLLGYAKLMLFDLFPFILTGIFFWIQFQISSQGAGFMTKIALASTVIVEISIIFIWSLFLS